MQHKRYFEDLALDELFVSQGRTLTEADNVMWSMVTADWTPLHVDEEFARTTPFGTRIPPGLMSQAITHGLLSRLDGPQRIASIAFLTLTVRYQGAVRIGDTLHAELRIKGKRLTSKGDKGIVQYDCLTLNQRNEVVQRGEWELLVACRPAARPAGGDRPAAHGHGTE